MSHEGGAGHVAAYLAERDLSKFNPRALPKRTPAFFDIVDTGQVPEDAELADALDQLGRPPCLFVRGDRCNPGWRGP